jgi:N-acetylneuraminate lyase
MTGVNLPMHRLLEEAAPRIPNLRGLKYTHSNLMEFQQCLAAADGKFDMLFGQDEILLAALAVGASGAVGSTYNYAAPLYLRMIEAFRAGNLLEAQRCARRAVALVDVLMEFGPMAAGKAIMSLCGVDCGPVRPPLPNLSEARREQLFERIRKLEVIDVA